MKVVISGGAGFIGSSAINYFLNKYKKWQILNIDSLAYSAIPGANGDAEKNKRYHFENVDIRDYENLSRAITKFRPDAILNFSAESHVDRSMNSSHIKEFLSTNVEGVINLLNIVNENKIEKFLQVSTDEVGGSWEHGGSFYEDDTFKPRNCYAASKGAAELFCNAYFESFNTPILISRCTNNFSIYQHEEKFIPRSVSRLIQGQPIELNLYGKPVRSWITTTNHIKAIDAILHNGIIGETYHVTGGTELTNQEIAEKILKELNINLDGNIIYKDIRPTDDLRYSIGSKKIHTIGYEPINDFDEHFAFTIAWYKEYFQKQFS